MAWLVLKMDAAQRKETRKVPLLSKLSSSQTQPGFHLLPEIPRNRTEGTICTSTFMSRTLLSQANRAHTPINPFFQVSSVCWDFCPASPLGMLLAGPELCSFQETQRTHLGSPFQKTQTMLIVKKDVCKSFLRKLQYL